MKTIFTCLAFVCIMYANAQTPVGNQEAKTAYRQEYGKNLSINIGGGVAFPNGKLIENANIGNLTNLNVGATIPFVNLGSNANFSLTLAGNYFIGNKSLDPSGIMTYNIMGQKNAPVITTNNAGKPLQQGYQINGGVQSDFHFGNFTISPKLSVGYLNLKQKAFTIIQSTDVNGQNREYNLFSQPDNKTTGVTFTPALTHKYKFGRDNSFAVFAEVNYLIGPSVNTTTSTFKPNGTADPKTGSYNIDQMMSGKNLSSQSNTKFNSFGVNVGIAISLFRKGWDGTVKGGSKVENNVVNPLYEGNGTLAANPLAKETAPKVKCACGTTIYGKDEAACKRICQFLKDGTYANAKLSPEMLAQIKEDYFNNMFNIENGVAVLKPELFKEIIAQSDGIGQKVSITKDGKSYAFLGNQDDLVKIVSIPSARPAGCVDCTTKTCNGVTYDCSCVRDFCFCVLCVVLSPIPNIPEAEKTINPNTENPTRGTIKNQLVEQSLVYTNDYSVTDNEVLSYLHTDQLVIKKGTYEPDFSNNPFGDITLELATPISAKGITQSGIKSSIAEPTSAKGITESGIKKTDIPPTNEKAINQAGMKKTEIAPSSERAIKEVGMKKNETAPASERAIKEVGMKRTETAPSNERAIKEVGMKKNETAPSSERAIKEVGMKKNETAPSSERAIREVGMKRTETAPSSEKAKVDLTDIHFTSPSNEKGINEAGLKRQQFSGIRCDATCTEEGDYCFTCKKSSASALFYEFEIIPVVENEMITHIILSNSSVSRNGIPITGYNPAGQPQNQSVVSTTRSNTKDRVSTDLGTGDETNPTGQPQNQNVVNTSKSNTKDRVAAENTEMMQVAYTGQDPVLIQTQLSVFGSGRILADGTPVVAGRVVGGKITGSIIINNGNLRVNNIISIKQPESGDEGSAVLDKEGTFTINLGSDTLHRIYINDKEFGKIKLESQQATTPSSNASENPLYEEKRKSGENPLSESSNVAKPGGPIGGIVVKGGRNPGGQIRMISGNDGSFTFQNSATADFKFTIETPETSGGNGNAARPGTPIGGIIVKGGKNPGGQMFTTTTNQNGEIEFKNLPAGDYKFIIRAPTDTRAYESLRKGWDGTVKGGSKVDSEHLSPIYKGN